MRTQVQLNPGSNSAPAGAKASPRERAGRASRESTREYQESSDHRLAAPHRGAHPSSAPPAAPPAAYGVRRPGAQPPEHSAHAAGPRFAQHFGHRFSRVRVRAASEAGFDDVPHFGAIPNLDLLPAAQARPPLTGGAPLKSHVLRDVGPRLGMDLSEVRVHQDEQAARAAEGYHARAFTLDGHIFAGRGVPDLQSHAGRDVLLHELVHVAQGRRNPALAGRVMRLPAADVVTQLEAKLAAKDKPGFFQVLRVEAGAHAASAVVRSALSDFFAANKITQAEAWRAVCLQVFGNEVGWPRLIKNFVEGVEGGQFKPPAGMPPATSDALWETAIQTSHTAAESQTDFDEYRGLFNSLWLSMPYRALSTEFNPDQTSRGPRSNRARAIFEHIYRTNAKIRAGYDIGGIVRTLIDQYFGPDALNIEASPRVNTLRNVFRRLPLAAATVADPDYVAFKAHLTTAAQDLDTGDRRAVEGSHEWQNLIARIVPNATLRSDVIQTIRTAWATRPAPGGPPAAPPPGPAPAGPAPAPLKLNADQQTFVTNLSLDGPATPLLTDNAAETLSFTPRSTRDPAGLTISSRVDITPSGLVQQGERTEHPWPPASPTSAVHSATVQVEGGATGFTDFVASLSVIPATGTITHTAPTATVRVQDERRKWFKTNVSHGLIFTDQNIKFLWRPVDKVMYYGGQQGLTVHPRLTAANRGLDVHMQGRLLKNGAVLHVFPRTEFGPTATDRRLGGVTVLESMAAPATPDDMKLEVDFFPSADPAAVAFHNLSETFKIHPGGAFNNAQVIKRAADDYKVLNSTAAGSILATMLTKPGQPARTAQAIKSGNIKLEPFLIRADSADYIRFHPAAGISPSNRVAYLMGHPAAADDDHTFIGVPGADAWRWGKYPSTLFINLTPSLATPGFRRSNTASGLNGLIDLIVHEAVHAVDYTPAGPDDNFESYKKEFRAYWASGAYDRRPGVGGAPGPLRSTAFDPGMDNKGPKSDRARAIFDHLYGSQTYPFVRPAYDNNTNQFREKVNAYIIPDGINLIVSVRLDNLRRAVEAYTRVGFAAHKARIRDLYALCDADDKREISGNRAWLDLVNSKYPPAELKEIKAELHIP